ncbi:hypothetical protein [Roseovarius sp. EL26]|uniref:hypothetical protein n=1 Tax=Roseovarius sp. EL26 TaxID=2126672 RepID=UPI000EA35CE2|nr:hypothetical protein [Roseovarius sp. EL26]
MSKNWHILRDANGLTLARHLPVRFDVQAETELPLAVPLRLAHQVRQDMWRALQNVRGLSPIVQVSEVAGGVRVIAGARIEGRYPHTIISRIEAVLNDPSNRQRWIRCARPRSTSRNISDGGHS